MCDFIIRNALALIEAEILFGLPGSAAKGNLQRSAAELQKDCSG
jgi:hypothetical protein